MAKTSSKYWTLLVDGIPQGKLNRTLLCTVLRQPMPNVLAGEDFPDCGQWQIEGRTITIVKIPSPERKEMVLVA